jgi:hypothetical protein
MYFAQCRLFFYECGGLETRFSAYGKKQGYCPELFGSANKRFSRRYLPIAGSYEAY